MPELYSFADAQSMEWPVLMAMDANSGVPNVALNRPVCVVGARRLVHLPLPAQTISKAQALIIHDAGGLYLRDLASKNRTLVNGQTVREVWLNPMDVLQFGPFAFQCYSGFDRTDDSPPTDVAELWLEPDGLASRQVVTVKQQTFLIGSRSGCDLLLSEPEIALAHAVLFARDGSRYLRDLSTPDGTTVNGSRIREVELHAGDEIRIGNSRIEYHPIRPRTVSVKTASDETVIDFAEPDAAGEVAEGISIAAERVRFEPSDAEAVATADSLSQAAEDQIVLPWDDPGPVEVTLVDSHH